MQKVDSPWATELCKGLKEFGMSHKGLMNMEWRLSTLHDDIFDLGRLECICYVHAQPQALGRCLLGLIPHIGLEASDEKKYGCERRLNRT